MSNVVRFAFTLAYAGPPRSVALVGHGEPLGTALERADEALYRAKRDGRNQCQIGLAVD